MRKKDARIDLLYGSFKGGGTFGVVFGDAKLVRTSESGSNHDDPPIRLPMRSGAEVCRAKLLIAPSSGASQSPRHHIFGRQDKYEGDPAPNREQEHQGTQYSQEQFRRDAVAVHDADKQ